ncbi:hypothetical protein GCM10020227_29290 [Streptomyces flavovirens]
MIGIGEQFEDAQSPVERLRSLCGHDALSLCGEWGGSLCEMTTPVPSATHREAPRLAMAPDALRGHVATARSCFGDISERVRSAEDLVQNPGGPRNTAA